MLLVLLVADLLDRWWVSQAPYRITREVSSTTDALGLEAQHRLAAFPHAAAADQGGTIYIYADYPIRLVALDASTGTPKWSVVYPGGISALVLTDQSLLAATAQGITAYRAQTGERLWFTSLGQGHVRVIPQLDESILRVYYGQTIFELDPASGAIADSRPSENVLWIEGEIEIDQLGPERMVGKNRITGQQIWESHHPVIRVEEHLEPQRYGALTLLVRTYRLGICALDLETGGYNWCRPETYVSNLGINPKGETGYILREDFVLVKLDLDTGAILSETTFSPHDLPETMRYQLYAYFVAITNDGKLLLVFGDSRELIVFGTG